MTHWDGPLFIWGAPNLARFYNLFDEETGEPDTAEIYYRHSRGQLNGVVSVGRSLCGYVPTMLAQFNKENSEEQTTRP